MYSSIFTEMNKIGAGTVLRLETEEIKRFILDLLKVENSFSHVNPDHSRK